MLHNTNISFVTFDTFNCKTLGIIDTSYYNPSQVITGNLLQILTPGYTTPVELLYNVSGVTILNSNSVGVTNVIDESYLIELPDGAYTIKMSACPYNILYCEQTFYRTCKLECKYDTAILYLDLNNCTTCYNQDLADKLNTARIYIEGCKANAKNSNIKKATELYNVANRILDDIINCKCWNNK